MTLSRYDVAIVGAGPVGLTLALALVRSMPGISVALLDRRPLSVPPDHRATALAAGVTRILEALDVWDRLLPDAAPIAQMKITDSGRGDLARPLFLSFVGDVVPGRPYAHMVPNTKVAAALIEAVGDRLTVLAPVTITGFAAGPAQATLSLADGTSVAATLVVAADGANSALRTMAGIDVFSHDYGQSGLVATIAHELDHEQTAYEHFRPAGPFASLPLPGRRSSLVWTEARADAERFKLIDKPAQETAIEAAMGSTLGTVTIEDKLQAYPLRLLMAKSFIAPRLALVGDAAHVIHPIAGQGLNLGLKDVAALAEVVIEAMRLGLDHGSDPVLADYQRWRRLDTSLMAMVTDGLNRLFSNDIAPVRALRDFGLGLVDRLPPVKSALIRQAAAIGGDGPRLTRGMPI